MMSSPPAGKHRMNIDVAKLVQSKHEVVVAEDMGRILVKFLGPKDTPYEGGVWLLSIVLTLEYPFKSPSIKFMNKIFHPNIDLESGSVCLNVLNQAWTPMYDLMNVVERFLPQLLSYPNPTDPMNRDAGALCVIDPDGFTKRVQQMNMAFATDSIVSRMMQSERRKGECDQNVSTNGGGGVGHSQSHLPSGLVCPPTSDSPSPPEDNDDDDDSSSLSELSDIEEANG